jgi:hypothetical protein
MDITWILVRVIVPLILVGLGLWVLSQLDFIDAAMKRIIRIVVIVLTVLWLLLGVFVPLIQTMDSGPGPGYGYHHRP